MGHLFAISSDNIVYRFRLDGNVNEQVQTLFLDASNRLKPANIAEVPFDGNYMLRQNEDEIFVVDVVDEEVQMLTEAANNMAATPAWDGTTPIKALIWSQDDTFYIQAFTKKNILTHRFVLTQSQDTYNRVTTNSLIIDEDIHAIYKEHKLYFANYAYANRIFNLVNYVVEATNDKIEEFGQTDGVSFDADWMKDKANSKTRRLIQSVSSAGTVPLFLNLGPRKRKALLKDFKVEASIVDNKIQFPDTIAKVNRLLEFLNEDIYKGILSGKTHHSNSKKTDN